METINLLKTDKNFLKCEDCIFNDGCEKMFTECVSNFINDEFGDDAWHLKYCNNDNYEQLTEDDKKMFIKKVLEINEHFKIVESNVK